MKRVYKKNIWMNQKESDELTTHDDHRLAIIPDRVYFALVQHGIYPIA